ncbi:hypothetical protein FRACA_2890002 [Frankia canadensis]|uniref:Uncharacterized protein n=1 Tax=Frankia canadensis TaxID=1836972 RepID=A0A2I2KTB1_9ACTN|nr:hypothetical protein FRACA_2890002 [Frankia canadensis]SOU56169.1 hypothetical protein FRACA_2890002 [Frankia canadensis]
MDPSWSRTALIEALIGCFDDHHATIAAALLCGIDTLGSARTGPSSGSSRLTWSPDFVPARSRA